VIPSSSTSHFPLILLKFGPSRKGQVQLVAMIEMNEAWFADQRKLIHDSIQIVGYWP